MEFEVPINQLSAAVEFGKRCTLLEIVCSSGSHATSSKIKEIDYSRLELKRKNAYVFEEKSNILSTSVALSLVYKEKKKEIFNISAVFTLEYRLNTNSPPEELRELFFGSFSELSTTHHCWPYWREYLDSMCRRMGLPAVVTPLIHFVPKKSPGDKKLSTGKVKQKELKSSLEKEH